MISLFRLHYDPQPDQRPYLARAQTKADEHAEVTVAVLTPAEARATFGVPLARRGIQAVWVRVVNRSPAGTRLLMTKIAPDYFTAREAAGLCHFSMLRRVLAFGFLIWFLLPIFALALPFKLWATRRANQRMNECFQALGFPLKNIAPGAVAEGIVFTPVEFGTKVVDVALVVSTQVRDYPFSIEVPAPHVDHEHRLATAQTEPPIDCDLETLRHKLTAMPATTTNARGLRTGDPVNLVVIGNFSSVIGVFAARWDQTEIITLGSCWRTVKAFLLGSEYRYSPVSALYLFQLPQTFALQRVRESINERLHLRLWGTPLRYAGKEVWVGQVSRDIGVRLTWRTWNLTTHRIDPDVDEARDYVMEDLFEAGRITAAGYIPGVGACTKESPRHNLTGDPYFSDGHRAVVMVSDERRIPQFIHWA
jgi:LssY C-terminus